MSQETILEFLKQTFKEEEVKEPEASEKPVKEDKIEKLASELEKLAEDLSSNKEEVKQEEKLEKSAEVDKDPEVREALIARLLKNEDLVRQNLADETSSEGE